MLKKPSAIRKRSAPHPRLVNQVVLDKMVTLRKQGFSHREIAEKVVRSERTVRRYLRGVAPQLKLPTMPKRVDVLAWCGKQIIAVRGKWDLTAEEVDSVIKELREAIDEKDALTREWFATDREARLEFLVREFLPRALLSVKTNRDIQHIIDELGPCAWEDDGEDDPAWKRKS